jgi:hypothetical protein
MLDATLAHLHSTPLGRQCVLRGSVLTERWVPGRRVNDLDFLVDGAWTPARLSPLVLEAFSSMPGVSCSVTTIWEETEFPGVRATLTRSNPHPDPLPKGEGDGVQVDFSWGELLVTPPIELEIRGRTWRTVTAEVMFGWKVHSLVEHGPRGRWHPKTMADLALLLRHVKLDRALAKRAIELSFQTQRLSLTLLDPFFDDPTWGASRGSRNKWKSYVKKSPWVTFTLSEAMAEVRAGLLPMLRG